MAGPAARLEALPGATAAAAQATAYQGRYVFRADLTAMVAPRA